MQAYVRKSLKSQASHLFGQEMHQRHGPIIFLEKNKVQYGAKMGICSSQAIPLLEQNANKKKCTVIIILYTLP